MPGKMKITSGKISLTAVFAAFFFGNLAAAGAHRIALDTESLRNARPELVGLDQDRGQCPQVIDPGTHAELVEHFVARAGPIWSCMLQSCNSSQIFGATSLSSSLTLRMPWSRPSPASTQTTSKSSASGSVRKICSLRLLPISHTIMSGQVKQQTAKQYGCGQCRLSRSLEQQHRPAGEK